MPYISIHVAFRLKDIKQSNYVLKRRVERESKLKEFSNSSRVTGGRKENYTTIIKARVYKSIGNKMVPDS